MKVVLLWMLLLTGAYRVSAQYDDYEKKIFVRGSDTLRYRILFPLQYDQSKTYPLVVFLHGSGERGNDNAAQLSHGGDLFLRDSVRKKYPAIVIFPQCPDQQAWSVFGKNRDTSALFYKTLNTAGLSTPERLVKELMDSMALKGPANKKRIYIGGLSLGGFGTYDLVIHYPNYFAAAFPICGQANVTLYTSVASGVPLWIFHGALDNVVSPQPDRELYQALISKKAKNVRYTEYPNANHNSWDDAFAEPNLLSWLFSNTK